ncbi:MAG: DUF4476 domain-containing protein [Ginsengibacter sp.]
MPFFPKFKRFLFLLAVFCGSLKLSAQEKHFIYLQTENNQPFYVKLDNNIMSSSSAGYIILPKLKQGNQTFFIGFPKSNKPEQKFEVKLDDNNRGFLIKDFDENGYALFDLQSLALLQKVGSDIVVAKQPEPAKDNNSFSQLLANVVNDSSILQNNKIPEPAIIKNNPDTIASAPQVVTKNEIVIKETTDASKAINSVTKKVLSIQEPTGMDMIYVDMHDGMTDTVRLFLPGSDKNVKTPKATITYVPEKTQATDSTLTITPTIVKAPEKNIYISDSSTKMAEVKEIVSSKPQASIVLRNAEGSIENENKNAPQKDSSIELIRNSENSDCKDFATENDFLKLRKKMAAENNTDAMIIAAKKYFKSRCFTTEQIKNLSFLFLDDEGKYKFFDAAYPFTSDSSQYESLQEQLKDEYYINRFKAMIHK